MIGQAVTYKTATAPLDALNELPQSGSLFPSAGQVIENVMKQ
jgi:hypothetical protein